MENKNLTNKKSNTDNTTAKDSKRDVKNNKKSLKKQGNNQSQKFGDIIENHDLIKRTLMVAAYPAMVKETIKEGKTVYSGFLPGFEFCEVEDIYEIGECMQQLQDMLDDEVEELIVFGKQLPDLGSDEELMKQYPGYDIRFLDINVYALPDEEWCEGDCSCCGHHCDEDFEEDDCNDDDCDCHHEHCDCDDDCDKD